VGGALALVARRCLRGRGCNLCTRAADDYPGYAAPWSAADVPAIPDLRDVRDELRYAGGSVSEYVQRLKFARVHLRADHHGYANTTRSGGAVAVLY
jgi:hypothetical protein